MKNKFNSMELRRKGYKRMLEELNSYIEDVISQKDKLKEQLREYNKDEKIQELTDKITMLRSKSVHIMSDSEYEESKKFSNEHYELCKGNIQYIVYGAGGIGTVIQVKCDKCDEQRDITDIDNW